MVLSMVHASEYQRLATELIRGLTTADKRAIASNRDPHLLRLDDKAWKKNAKGCSYETTLSKLFLGKMVLHF